MTPSARMKSVLFQGGKGKEGNRRQWKRPVGQNAGFFTGGTIRLALRRSGKGVK